MYVLIVIWLVLTDAVSKSILVMLIVKRWRGIPLLTFKLRNIADRNENADFFR